MISTIAVIVVLAHATVSFQPTATTITKSLNSFRHHPKITVSFASNSPEGGDDQKNNNQVIEYSDFGDDFWEQSSEAVDLDAEWQKVVNDQKNPFKSRPKYYSEQNDVEKAVTRARRQADQTMEDIKEFDVREAVNDAKSAVSNKWKNIKRGNGPTPPRGMNMSSGPGPGPRSLQGDWKFWIGILAVISIAASVIAGSAENALREETFYI